METGAKFREFISKESYSSKLSKEVYEKNDRQPDFLAIWVWSHIFVEELQGGEHMILDGTPRSIAEADVLGTALRFYKRDNPVIINLDVSREWSEKHLMARKRQDDKDPDAIKKRLDWYEKDVAPAIEQYAVDPSCNFIKINGEQTIEEVHADIIRAVFGRKNAAVS